MLTIILRTLSIAVVAFAAIAATDANTQSSEYARLTWGIIRVTIIQGVTRHHLRVVSFCSTNR